MLNELLTGALLFGPSGGLIVHHERHAHMWSSSPLQAHPTSLQRSALHASYVLVEEVLQIIETGEIIEQYLDDAPYASCLILGYT